MARTVTRLDLDPMTRVGGGLAAHVDIDRDAVTDAWVAGTQFRGYESIIDGRDARDVMPLASRSCGWCGAVHQTTASMACEMAWGAQTPPMALALRSIAEATEAIWIHAAHLAVRAGPDYCRPVIETTSPSLWKKADRTPAPGADTHGYRTIADIMEAMTPVTGHYWYTTIPAGRRVQEMISLIYGKYPHPSVLSPGGVGSTLTLGNFTEYFTRLYRSVDYVKKVIALWDDLLDFLLDADPRFAELGVRPASFIHAGCWDDPDTHDGTWANLDTSGANRLARAGVVQDGRLVTTSLREIHDGITEDVSRSFYQPADGSGTAPDGGGLPGGHPWNRSTVAVPGPTDLQGRYSWSTAPRWRGEVFETTPLGRLWLAATDDRFPANDFIEPTGTSLRILVPANDLPETIVEWHVPERANAIERLRADAYGIAFSGLCAAIALLKGFAYTRSGTVDVSSGFEVPKAPTSGVGLYESGRGMNAHWLRTDKGHVTGYQIVGPSTWNASPRDGAGVRGPIEQALIGSALIEEPHGGRYRGLDAMRVIRSFDPCMTCGTH